MGGGGCQRKEPCDEGVGTFSFTPQSSGREEGTRDSVQSPMAKDVINHGYTMKPP